MSRVVRANSDAWRDVMEIYGRIALDKPDAASEFFKAFDRGLELIREQPGGGTIIEPEPGKFRGARSWPLPGFRTYLLIYRPVGDDFEVVRVLHGARDIRRVLAEA